VIGSRTTINTTTNGCPSPPTTCALQCSSSTKCSPHIFQASQASKINLQEFIKMNIYFNINSRLLAHDKSKQQNY
jgi:hypothetical protein